MLVLTTSVFGIIFECSYSDVNWYMIGNRYTCHPKVINTGSENILEAVQGNHLNGKGHFDVKALYPTNQNLKFIPMNLVEFFPNIDAFQFVDANLFSISSEHLKPFPKLLTFGSYNNSLISLSDNLFEFTPDIMWIVFQNNSLERVGKDFLMNLKDLKYVDFRQNPCINVVASTPEGLQLLKNQLTGCSAPLIEVTTVNQLPQCPKICTDEIESLKKEVKDVIKVNADQETKLASLNAKIDELMKKQN